MDKYDAIVQAINAEQMVGGPPMSIFVLESVAQALRESAAEAFEEADRYHTEASRALFMSALTCGAHRSAAKFFAKKAAALRAGAGEDAG